MGGMFTARPPPYLAMRLADPRYADSVLKTFTVSASYVGTLRAARSLSGLRASSPRSPLVADAKAAGQSGLCAGQLAELPRSVIPGSGGTWP